MRGAASAASRASLAARAAPGGPQIATVGNDARAFASGAWTASSRRTVDAEAKEERRASHEHQTATNAEDAMDKSAASYSVQTPGGTTSETLVLHENKHVPAERPADHRLRGRPTALAARRRGRRLVGTRTRTRTGRPARATSTRRLFREEQAFHVVVHVVTFVVVRASIRTGARAAFPKTVKTVKKLRACRLLGHRRRRRPRAPPVGRHASPRRASPEHPGSVFVARDVDSARPSAGGASRRNLWTGDGRPRAPEEQIDEPSVFNAAGGLAGTDGGWQSACSS